MRIMVAYRRFALDNTDACAALQLSTVQSIVQKAAQPLVGKRPAVLLLLALPSQVGDSSRRDMALQWYV